MALTLRLHNLEGAAPDGEVQAVVADISEKLASLVGEIAAVSDRVHQRLELLGLTTACLRFCEDLSARYNVAIHFQDEEVPRYLPSDIALALAAEIRLQIVDRGVGFDTLRAVPSDGVGLVAIRERLKLVKGDSVIVSRPGEGTRVEAWVPLRPDASRSLV